jgi:hypothetical protein
MSALESLAGGRLPLARALFFVSCVFSFAPAYNRGERAQAALSFSYSAFIVIVFLPPVHVFLKPLEPRGAILADAAEYAALSFAVHHFIMTPFSDYFAPRWKYGYLAVNAGITLAGIAFLFSAL